jgi:hypothetical protein
VNKQGQGSRKTDIKMFIVIWLDLVSNGQNLGALLENKVCTLKIKVIKMENMLYIKS